MQYKIVNLLLLRLLQCKRILDSVGYLLLIIFLLVVAGIGVTALSNLITINRWWSNLAIIALFLLIEYQRKDKAFLQSVFENRTKLRLYLALEYLIISFPILIAQILLGHLNVAIIIFALPFMFGYISSMYLSAIKSTTKREIWIIPLKFFELKFVVESSPIFYLMVWILGFLSVLHIGAFLFWLFILVTLVQQFFIAYETKDMIHWHPYFVFSKVRMYLRLVTIIIAMPTCLVLFLNITYWPLIVYGLAGLSISIFLAISLKYSNYTPLRSNGQISSLASLFTLFIIIPGGAFITLVYALWNYFKAEKNLKSLYA